MSKPMVNTYFKNKNPKVFQYFKNRTCVLYNKNNWIKKYERTVTFCDQTDGHTDKIDLG